ncbi:hypothetical protein CDAR_29291 [Caerostris darwini]|uniref:Uncharacterized protein n=1 Tax=Caerostris darwini TaxID=1538125 RepID=A0AAV4RZ54_9ARAC|nr:hypothetical protein CDAR_29291 [Caerostris darwini]
MTRRNRLSEISWRDHLIDTLELDCRPMGCYKCRCGRMKRDAGYHEDTNIVFSGRFAEVDWILTREDTDIEFSGRFAEVDWVLVRAMTELIGTDKLNK